MSRDLNSPLIALAQDICMHLSDASEPCDPCLMRAGEHLRPQTNLKNELRRLITKWRDISALLGEDNEQGQTLLVNARDLERLIE